MDDHVHVLVRPYPGWRLEQVIQSWKSYTGHRIATLRDAKGPIWQDEYYDRLVRSERALMQTARYIANNPRKRWPDEDGQYSWMEISLGVAAVPAATKGSSEGST